MSMCFPPCTMKDGPLSTSEVSPVFLCLCCMLFASEHLHLYSLSLLKAGDASAESCLNLHVYTNVVTTLWV